MAVEWRIIDGHSPKIRLWLANITWVNSYAKFEDLLKTSAVISKICFEHRQILCKDF